jgi:hypothetical protein
VALVAITNLFFSSLVSSALILATKEASKVLAPREGLCEQLAQGSVNNCGSLSRLRGVRRVADFCTYISRLEGSRETRGSLRGKHL